MKKAFAILGLGVFGLTSLNTFAQDETKYGATPEDQQSCKEKLSLYREYRDQKLYDDAFTPWKAACAICPKSAKTLYTDGVKFYTSKINKEKDEAKKQEYVDALLAVYDARIENFGEKAKVLGKKAQSTFKYNSAEPMIAVELFKQSISERKGKSDPSVLSTYYLALYTAVVKEQAQKEELISEYLVVSDYLDAGMSKANEKYVTYYKQAKDAVDELFIKVAECSEVEAIAVKQFEANPTDVETLKKLSVILQKRDCIDAEIYEKVAGKLNELEPSATASYGLGVYMLKKGRYGEALTFLEKAVDLVEDEDDKLKYLLAASGAAIATGKYASGASFARKALSLDPNNGRAYLSIGQAIAASANSCGDNDFTRKAVYWLAVDYFVKAKNVDSSVSSDANKLINAYTARFPDKTVKFQYGYTEGSPKMKEPIKIGCWINESVNPR